jgi:adenine-specific DNA methylase
MPAVKSRQKHSGAYFTPADVAATLTRWALRTEQDRMIDPSCGDGQFISLHRNSVGIEQDGESARSAIERAPWALVHEGDFFAWATETEERFECAAGNPPFIRYQTFNGDVRARAAALCRKLGAEFSGLASSWAPFLVATASLLKRGGRMAFVVPAELGHAPYAVPLLQYLVAHFAHVQVVAVRDKLFPDLSEDCWLLYADGHGGKTDAIVFSKLDRFTPSERPPQQGERVAVTEWATQWNSRLRPYLLDPRSRDAYRFAAVHETSARLGDIAAVGIGYVSGANDFFHLRPSEARARRIPAKFLHPTVRNGRALPSSRLTKSVVERWERNDDPVLLLRLPKDADLPNAVRAYLDTDDARQASSAYKCRVRDPWYSVPDVVVPDFFLSYMSGEQPSLVRNDAHCTCTNSVHAVRVKDRKRAPLLKRWGSPLAQLSAELEGHPLGGGMLKLEPREAAQLVFADQEILEDFPAALIAEATSTLRSWRHYGGQV